MDKYYINIKNMLLEDITYSRIKDYSKERHKVLTYYEVGKELSEAGKHYGEDIVGKYAERLKKEIGKKYTSRYLRYIRKFYLVFSDENWNPLGSNLNWSHYRVVLSLKIMNILNII